MCTDRFFKGNAIVLTFLLLSWIDPMLLFSLTIFWGATLLYRKLQSKFSIATTKDKMIFVFVSSSIIIFWASVLLVNIDFIKGSFSEHRFIAIAGYFIPFFGHIIVAYLFFKSGWTLKQFPKNSKFTFSIINYKITPHFSGNKKQLLSAITSLESLLKLMINEESQRYNTIILISPLLTTKSENLLSRIITKINLQNHNSAQNLVLNSSNTEKVGILIRMAYFFQFSIFNLFNPFNIKRYWRLAFGNWRRVTVTIQR